MAAGSASAGSPVRAAPTATAARIGDRYPIVWHQLRSISPVATTIPAPPDRRGLVDGDRGGARPEGGRRVERRDRRARPALVADPDDEAAVLRRERRLERLDGGNAARSAGAADAAAGRCLADDGGKRLRPVLARPAAGHHDRLALLERPADGRRQTPRRRVAARRLELRRDPGDARAAPDDPEPPEHPPGERGLGLDHLGHPPGRTVPAGRLGERRPRLRRPRERRLGVRMGGDGGVEWRGRLHGLDDRLRR